MKRILVCFLAAVLILGLAACAAPAAEKPAPVHKIGVAVYDLTDSQVMAFRDYLENYIALTFEDVEFVYSMSIQSQAEMMAFLQSCIDSGVEGILNCNSYDLEKEVALCAENGVYMLCPSATAAPEMFEKVEDCPYFLGYFGPGTKMEYEAGYEMGSFFAENGFGDTYFILSGGAPMGNAMHKNRTAGILDALQENYGVTFDRSSEELAVVSTPTTVTEGPLTVHIYGGYPGIPGVDEGAISFFAENPSDCVLGVIPVGSIAGASEGAALGIIDCYSQENARLFESGKLRYLCGKFSSIIGPGFAAMYNAVTGHAEAFRDNGKAFRIEQGFWVSTSREDFNAKFALSSGIALNAYSAEDLLGVIAEYNPQAGIAGLRALANACTFEDAQTRRGS